MGFLHELDPVEAGAVRCLRVWAPDDIAQARLHRDFAIGLGPDHGARAAGCFCELCGLCTRHGRRPLRPHAEDCPCLGADESWFARFVGAASTGDREEALMIAVTLVRPDLAPILVGLGQTVGLALRRMALRSGHRRPANQGMGILH